MQILSDLDLILRVQSGDDSAFTELMRRHFKGVVNYIYRFTHNPQNSEDLAQDVFLRVYRSLDKYKPQAKFSTWLYRIATNVCISSLKSSGKNSDTSLDEVSENSQIHIDERADNAVDLIYRQEISKAVFKALSGLPERERIAVILCKYEEMPYEEAAEVIGCSVGAVKAYVHRGRMKLIEKLKPFLSEDVAHGSED
ncbi:MAG: sigma-70 family RNA polymerase sigma factor [Candidatus Methanosuratincola sp.]|jgi:RNA polymerase sigma-70 factor (ECF subfamily)